MESVLLSILKANIFAVITAVISYVIEALTDLKLLVKRFLWEKGSNSAEIAADAHAGYYALLCLIIYIMNIKNGKIELLTSNIILWLIIVIPLSILVRLLYFKNQGIDYKKKDEDFI